MKVMNLCTNGSFQMPQKKRGMNGTKTTHQIKRSGGTNESTMNLQPMATMAKREHETENTKQGSDRAKR